MNEAQSKSVSEGIIKIRDLLVYGSSIELDDFAGVIWVQIVLDIMLETVKAAGMIRHGASSMN